MEEGRPEPAHRHAGPKSPLTTEAEPSAADLRFAADNIERRWQSDAVAGLLPWPFVIGRLRLEADRLDGR